MFVVDDDDHNDEEITLLLARVKTYIWLFIRTYYSYIHI